MVPLPVQCVLLSTLTKFQSREIKQVLFVIVFFCCGRCLLVVELLFCVSITITVLVCVCVCVCVCVRVCVLCACMCMCACLPACYLQLGVEGLGYQINSRHFALPY